MSEFIRYAILLSRISDAPTPKEIVLRHVAHLRTLDEGGKLVLAGPFVNHASGMVVVRARDKQEAVAIAESDPFVVEGVRSFEVRTWMLACAENAYLA